MKQPLSVETFSLIAGTTFKLFLTNEPRVSPL